MAGAGGEGRDRAVLKQAIRVMGSSVPGDSTATGSVTITAGSNTESGTIKILTRGSSQSLEQITTSTGATQAVYSNGVANDSSQIATKPKDCLHPPASGPTGLFA